MSEFLPLPPPPGPDDLDPVMFTLPQAAAVHAALLVHPGLSADPELYALWSGLDALLRHVTNRPEPGERLHRLGLALPEPLLRRLLAALGDPPHPALRDDARAARLPDLLQDVRALLRARLTAAPAPEAAALQA